MKEQIAELKEKSIELFNQASDVFVEIGLKK